MSAIETASVPEDNVGTLAAAAAAASTTTTTTDHDANDVTAAPPQTLVATVTAITNDDGVVTKEGQESLNNDTAAGTGTADDTAVASATALNNPSSSSRRVTIGHNSNNNSNTTSSSSNENTNTNDDPNANNNNSNSTTTTTMDAAATTATEGGGAAVGAQPPPHNIPVNDSGSSVMSTSGNSIPNNNNTTQMMMMMHPTSMGTNSSISGSGASIGGASHNNNSMMGGGAGGGFGAGGFPNTSANNLMMMDHRRGSMGSMGGFGMDDFFGHHPSNAVSAAAAAAGARRNSFGFDMGMEHFFGRRDSMDSSTAALDMAIMDLSRRRYSAAMGAVAPMTTATGAGGSGSNMMGTTGPSGSTNTPDHLLGVGGGSVASSNMPSQMGVGAVGNFGFHQQQQQQQFPLQPHGGMMGSSMGSPAGAGGNNDSILLRQRQLQQQQRELEQRQKELEFQRQQLISSMQERSYGGPMSGTVGAAASGMGPGGAGTMMPSMYHPNSHPFPQHQHHPHRGSLGGLGGSLGLGSVQSQGTASLPSSHMPTSSNSQLQQQYPLSSSGSAHRPTSVTNTTTGSADGGSATTRGSSAGTQKWWICQVCQSKAFVSQDEALAHEAICQEVRHSMPPMPYSHDLGMGMGRNFSMGFGMDTSQRGGMAMGGMGMGMGGMSGMGGLTTMIDNSSRGVVSLGMDSSRGGSSMDFDRSRNMSLGMDSSSSNYTTYGGLTMSTGPVNMFIQPVPLAMPSDKDWLTPLHCFVRLHCVEVFTATKADVATPSKGKRKPIQVGQVGIRCPHCSGTADPKSRERGSVYYPTSISSIYNATMNLLQRHLHNCPSVPDDIMRRYETLKADDARSGTSKRYWIESALSLGLVDTPDGIRHSALPPPPLPTLTRQQETTGQDVARRASSEYFGSSSNLIPRDKSESGQDGTDGVSGDNSGKGMSYNDPSTTIPLVVEADKPYATEFSYELMDQMQPCVFTEADRLGKRKGLPPGFPGLACRHCFGGYGSGRFFPSTIKTLSDTSKTLNVLHNHMMRCRKCPSDVKEKLEKLRVSHDDERSKMKFGSQKAFFGRIWDRLHGSVQGSMGYSGMPDSSQRKGKGGKRAAMEQQQHHHHHQQFHHQHDQMMNGFDMHGGGLGGLEALAAASSPSKRSKA